MGKKLKYKDVVKKKGQNFSKKNGKGGFKSKKRNDGRKTYSVYKRNNNFKRKTTFDDDAPNNKKLKENREEPVLPRVLQPPVESESEDETEIDAMKQLRDTFGGKINVDSIISESSSSESDEENNLNDNEGDLEEFERDSEEGKKLPECR